MPTLWTCATSFWVTPNVACCSSRAASVAEGGGTVTGVAGTEVVGAVGADAAGFAGAVAGAVGVDGTTAAGAVAGAVGVGAAVAVVVVDAAAVGVIVEVPVLVAAVPVPAVAVVVEVIIVEEVDAVAEVVVGAPDAVADAGAGDAVGVPVFAAMDVSLGVVDVPSPPQALKLSVNNKLVVFHRDAVSMMRYLGKLPIEIIQQTHSKKRALQLRPRINIATWRCA